MRNVRKWSTALATALAIAGSGLVIATAAPAVAATVTQPLASPRLPSSNRSVLTANYAVPANAVFVSPGGSDSNPGTKAQPFKTLNYAFAKLANTGGTIVMRGGIYREGASGYATGGTNYVIRPKNVTVQSYPSEIVWLEGTVPVTNWKKVASNDFTVAWSTPAYCAGQYYSRHYSNQTTTGPCSHSDAIGGTASIGDPQMIFVNGVQIKQVASIKSLAANTFYYDWSAKVMHLGFDPAGKTVEVTKHPQALALFSPTNVTIKGIGFRRYASNQYENATNGALLINSGSNVKLERVVLTENAGTGLLAWQSNKLVVRHSILSANGANGFHYSGSGQKHASSSSVRDDITVEYTRFDRNNADSFSVNCTYSCSSAGSKMAYLIGATIRYNSFNDNKGKRASGYWCDLNCKEVKIYGNQVTGNSRHGIVYEVSNTGVIASNLLVGNGWESDAGGGGSAILAGSANTRIYNNTLVDNKVGISVYDDDRSPGVSAGYAAYQLGPNSVNNEVVNNIVVTDRADSRALLGFTGGKSGVSGNTTAKQVFKTVNNNSYAKPANSVYFALWRPRSSEAIQVCATTAELRTKSGLSLETKGTLVAGKSTAYLVAPASGDYRVKASSAADNSGAALPADIAKLLGVTSAGAVDRGVITVAG